MQLDQIGQLREPPKQVELADELMFGKYKGMTLEEVIYEDPGYIQWCIENIKDFVLADKAYILYTTELELSQSEERASKKTRRELGMTGDDIGTDDYWSFPE